MFLPPGPGVDLPPAQGPAQELGRFAGKIANIGVSIFQKITGQ